MVDTPLSRAPVTPERILHDIRAVVDVSELDVIEIGVGTWLVLRTIPAPHSGSVTVRGIVVDGDTGQLVNSSGAEASLDVPGAVVYEGSYEILTVLSGQVPARSGQYSWREPQQVVVRGVPREHVYHPFALPGTVVCRYNPAAGESPFDAVHLLPEGWETNVEEAMRAPRETSPEILREWLAALNPLLFTRAVTTMARDGRVDAGLLASLLERTTGYPRAVVYFAALRNAEQLGAEVLQVGLDADFAETSEPDRRRSAALGLLTAKVFAPEATTMVLGDWTPLNRPAGFLDAGVVAGDPYVAETFALLVPA